MIKHHTPELTDTLSRLPIHFIVGAARSGTSLLRTILNAHPQVVSTGEMRYVMAFYGKYAHSQSVGLPRQFTVDVQRYEQMRLKNVGKKKQQSDAQLRAKQQQFMEQLRTYAPQMDYATACKMLLLGNKLNEGSKTPDQLLALINKNPDYIFYVPQLLQLYPQARIIACIRHPQSVVLSHKQHKGKNDFSQYMGDSVAAVAYFWEVCNRRILRLKEQYPEQIMLVGYEQLVTDKEAILRQICAFLSLPFDEALLHHHEQQAANNQAASANRNSADDDQWRQKKQTDLSKSVYTDRLAAWQQQLSPNEIALTTAISEQSAQQLGYPAAVTLTEGQARRWRWANAPRIALSAVVCWVFIIHYFKLPLWLRGLFARYLKVRK